MTHPEDMSFESAARRRYAGGFSGLRYEAEACPDADGALKAAAVGGAAGFAGAWLIGAHPVFRLLAAGAGAAAGAVLTRYHLYLDWDPDRYRLGGAPGLGDEEGAPEA